MDGTPFLRRADQVAIAVINSIALVAILGWMISQGWQSGELIEIEHAPKKSAEYIVDINYASWAELSQLPGIGETLAKRIVESREQQGRYRQHDDLLRVKGIGEKKLATMRGYLKPI